MNKERLNGLVIFAFFIIAMMIYWLLPRGETKVLLQYTTLLSSLVLACIAGIYTIKKYGTDGTKSTTLFLLTGGMMCWLAGESLWTYYEHVLHIDPFPSSADVFYIAGYPLFFFALFREITTTKINWHTFSKGLIFLMIVVSILLIGVVCYFGVYLAYSPTESLLTNSIAIGYGLADLILIIATMALLVLAWEFRGGILSRIWMSLFISFLLTLVADILFAIFTNSYDNTDSFYRGLTDSIFILSYLFFAYGLFNFGLSIESAKELLKKLIKKAQPNNPKKNS